MPPIRLWKYLVESKSGPVKNFNEKSWAIHFEIASTPMYLFFYSKLDRTPKKFETAQILLYYWMDTHMFFECDKSADNSLDIKLFKVSQVIKVATS